MIGRAFRALLIAAVVAPALVVLPSAPAEAVTGSDWNPGYIVSDQSFFNGSAMTADQVQAFLNQKVPVCQDGYTCLKDFHQATPSIPANEYCAAYVGSADERASDIIAKVGIACNLSQKAILVTLQKEQSLVTHTWPSPIRFDKAMGYGCPDTALCSGEWAGFFLQVYFAAKQFQRYGDPATRFTWYPVGAWTAVRYSPNVDCGSEAVYIQNRATAALYYYTPYQPNAAALENMPGIGDSCSAYGNRNFWWYYWKWFGSPVASDTPAVPVTSTVSPVWGLLAGGTSVTITGSAFTGASDVTFDGVAGTSLSVASDTSLTVTSPAHAAGPVDVVVTTPGGASSPVTFWYSDSVVLTDIAGGPFEADIQWMADQGISTGYADGTFRPAENVSRQAMAAFMYRFAGSPAFTPPVTSPFNDVPTDSPFYTEICWMSDQAISTGYADGGFHPTANVSRQAMAAFMYRSAGRPAFTPPGTSPFTDVPTDSPFYTEIAWMADTAISTGYADGGFHPGANVSRQAMAAFMHRLDGVLNPI